MLGQIAFALWIAAVTLGGVYLGQSLSAGPEMHGAETGDGGHGSRYNEVQTDLFAIPHIDKSGIAGYLTGRFTIKTVAAEEAALKIPLNTLIFDSLSRHFYAEAGAFATSAGWERLRETLGELRSRINDTAGRQVVAEVLIEQLDYFSKEDIRMGDEQTFSPAKKEEE
jgi:hypothetical protein